MDEIRRSTVTYLGALESGAPASCALREHRVALIDDLNRLSGPPSPHMAQIQQEFIDARLDAAETLAFATFCYSLLAAAVADTPPAPADTRTGGALPCTLPCYNEIFFSTVIPADIMESRSLARRQDLVDRYNDAVGPPGAQVAALQGAFLGASLDRAIVARYIQQCEEMIEACNSLRYRRFG